MSFPRYPAYKDSGVEWLGKVPEHWSVAALNYRYEVQLGKMLDEKRITGEHLAPYLRNIDVQWGRINVEDLPQMDFSGDDIERYGLRTGDLLVCEGGEVGRAAIWSGQLAECFYQKALHRLRARRSAADVPRFQMYLLRAAADLGIFVAGEGKSTIAHLTAEALRRYRFAYPSPEEQVAIVTFLDRETAKIDALIAEQERLIELLKEKRQAVISHAVTKGLDPDVPMKDSGVEWLGEVPAHWDVCSLKRVFVAVDYGVSDSLEPDGLVAILRMGNIQDGRTILDDLKYLPEVDEALLLQPGDLLFNRTNSVDLIGKVGLFESLGGEPVSFASYLVRLRLRQAFSPRFFAYMLNTDAVLGRVRASAFVAIGQANLNPTRYGEMQIVLPPPAEQDTIADFLQAEADKIDLLVAGAFRAVNLLKERRAALISAAVAGQIDARGLVDERIKEASQRDCSGLLPTPSGHHGVPPRNCTTGTS